MSLTHEICIDSVAGAIAAEKAGAQRVELCTALFDGGLTPTLGTVRAALAAVSSIRVHVIIRPRGGDFIFDEHEIAAMEHDVALARDAGVHGVVIGALTPDGAVDRPVTERLIASGIAGNVLFGTGRRFVETNVMQTTDFAAAGMLVGLFVFGVFVGGAKPGSR